MRELRALHGTLLEVFDRYGYGEVRTPTIEYDEVIARGDSRTAAAGYRLFGEHGGLLALRSDMTVPIARLAASRFADAPLPLRFSYIARAFRAVRPQSGQMREFEQAGVELIGAPAPQGTAEIVEVLNASLDAAGLSRSVIGLGDADLYPDFLTEHGIEGETKERALELLERHDLVGLEAHLAGIESLAPAKRAGLLELCQLRGGGDVFDRIPDIDSAAVREAVARLRETFDAAVNVRAGDRVQIDLGLVRDLGYYTGAVIEVYDPSLGYAIGGGGRYDRLLSRFGQDLPAAGFSLYVERLHLARAAEASA